MPGVLPDTALCRCAVFFSRDIEFFQCIPDTVLRYTKVGRTLLLCGIGKIGDMLFQGSSVKTSRPLGARLFIRQWVFGIQPVIDASPRDLKRSGGSGNLVAAIGDKIKDAFA